WSATAKSGIEVSSLDGNWVRKLAWSGAGIPMAPKKALSAGHVPAWCCNRYSSASVATFSGCDERRVASSPKRLSLLIGPPILPIQQQGLTAGNCNIG